MSAYPAAVLRASVVAVSNAKRPERLVIVHDDDHGEVQVRWTLGRLAPYRCSACGPMTTADCDHTFAAGVALAELLLGLTRTPDYQPTGAAA